MPQRDSKIQQVARELRAMIDARHAQSVGEQLGCRVTVLRRVQRRRQNGQVTGISEPVFGMAPEFIEHAQALGLLAEAL